MINQKYTFAAFCEVLSVLYTKKWPTKGLVSLTFNTTISPHYTIMYHQHKVENYPHHFKQTSAMFFSFLHISLSS